jgi:hypothetical protein
METEEGGWLGRCFRPPLPVLSVWSRCRYRVGWLLAGAPAAYSGRVVATPLHSPLYAVPVATLLTTGTCLPVTFLE